jgi:hypothetical protein
MKIEEQIGLTKAEMQKSKPRSRRRVELEIRLRDLVLKELQSGKRIKRRVAA